MIPPEKRIFWIITVLFLGTGVGCYLPRHYPVAADYDAWRQMWRGKYDAAVHLSDRPEYKIVFCVKKQIEEFKIKWRK